MVKDIVRVLGRADVSEATVMAVDLQYARGVQAEFRARQGFRQAWAPMLGRPADNVKASKGEGSWTLTLAPASDSGLYNVCRYVTGECREACVLHTSGKGAIDSVRRGRRWKSILLGEEPAVFLRLLVHELDRLPVGALVRLNTASDIPWERIVPWLFERYSHLRFYDYTKWTGRGGLPGNYRLTFSISERQSLAEAIDMARAGRSVAVVMNRGRADTVPAMLGGVVVVDGDVDDNRFDDGDGVIVALRAKGAAIKAPAGDKHFVKAVA